MIRGYCHNIYCKYFNKQPPFAPMKDENNKQEIVRCNNCREPLFIVPIVKKRK